MIGIIRFCYRLRHAATSTCKGELEFDRKRGSLRSATQEFRLVGLLDEDGDKYYLYFTNLPRDEYPAPNIAQLYRARWEVELLFKKLISRFRLDEINTTDPYSTGDHGRNLTDDEPSYHGRASQNGAKRRDIAADADSSASELSSQQCSVAIIRHAHLIQLYPMVELAHGLRIWTSYCCGRHKIQIHID